MVYLKPFLRLAVSGTSYGAEGWSFGFSFANDIGNESIGPDTVPAGIVTALSNFMSGPVSSQAHMTTVKLNYIDIHGHYVRQGNTIRHDFTNPGVPGGLNNDQIPQVALAVSLRTLKARGRAHAGRFYLPLPAFTMASDGRISAQHAADAASMTTTLLNACNTALPGFHPAIVSNLGIGSEEAVMSVRAGRVYDTMRSRRTKLDEDYQESGVALTH